MDQTGLSIPQRFNQIVQVVPCSLTGSLGYREEEQKSVWKKILNTTPKYRKKSSNVVSLKKVTFDVSSNIDI